jgi:hypothetical protein
MAVSNLSVPKKPAGGLLLVGTCRVAEGNAAFRLSRRIFDLRVSVQRTRRRMSWRKRTTNADAARGRCRSMSQAELEGRHHLTAHLPRLSHVSIRSAIKLLEAHAGAGTWRLGAWQVPRRLVSMCKWERKKRSVKGKSRGKGAKGDQLPPPWIA